MNVKLVDKLHKRTKVINGHWLWTGSIGRNGYGRVQVGSKLLAITRVSVSIYHKEHIDNSWVACHIDSLCKYKHCWNPLHLYAGTQKENVSDMIVNGNHTSNLRKNRTHCPRGHEFTEENIYIGPRGERQCRKCKYLTRLAWRARHGRGGK